MDRYETNSKGIAPALSELLNKFANMPQSAFDESRVKIMDAAPYGIFPVECFLMFPNSDMYVTYGVDCISRNPTIKRMLSSMSIEMRTYVCKCSDLWEGWNNFITKGRSGKLNLTIPTLDFIHASGKHTALPYNPYHLLNISPAVDFAINQSFEKNQGVQDPTETDSNSDPVFDSTGLEGSSFSISTSLAYNSGQSALPAVMYAKIAKEYQNANLLQDNPYWYPENENHDLILPYNCTHAANASYDDPTIKFGDTETISGVSITHDTLQPSNDLKSLPWLNVLYYRQRKGNYYNTGSPFPDLLRGDIPTLDIVGAELNSDQITKLTSTSIGVGTSMDETSGSTYTHIGLASTGKFLFGNVGSNNVINSNNPSGYKPQYADALSKLAITDPTYKISDKTVKGLNISMNQWRRLAALTVFRERMARTDGSYNQMIESQFMHNPKWHEHSVKYCGGHYQPLVFSEVVQNSADGATPLGTTAGRIVSSNGSDSVTIHADDYSIMMTVLTITPDDFYSQGIDRMWSELTQAEQYFPILNNLEPQAIKNKELFLTGTDSDDEDILNYQELFSHFKSRQNQVTGLCSLPVSKVGDVGCYVFNRLLNAKPEFNNNFVTGKFTDNENLCFASTEQAQFILRIQSMMKYVAPIPAVTMPSDMGLSY